MQIFRLISYSLIGLIIIWILFFKVVFVADNNCLYFVVRVVLDLEEPLV